MQGEDGDRTVTGLTDAGIGSTRVATTAGFLQQGNVTLLIGVADDQVQKALDSFEKM